MQKLDPFLHRESWARFLRKSIGGVDSGAVFLPRMKLAAFVPIDPDK
jgi:hypothetical protein